MSDLFTPSYSTRCQGWSNPYNLVFGPKIIGLSSFYSPAGSTSLVSITGENFYSYSSVSFGIFNPTVYFVNSKLIQFYVPSTLNAGTYPIQVFNGSFPSNIVEYTIDNSSGYWLLQPNGSIINTNISRSGIVSVQSLSRGTPVTISEVNSIYDVPNDVNWIICRNDTAASPITLLLPSGPIYTGRELMLKSVPNTSAGFGAPTVYTTQQNIVPLDGGLQTNTIFSGGLTAQWLTIVYDGSCWVIMQSN
jgi:hypothetical protein